MVNHVIVIAFCFAAVVMGHPDHPRVKSTFLGYPFPFVTREEWEASPPNTVTHLQTPVPYVVIHHTYVPEICLTKEQCMKDMRSMQRMHQNTNKWADIGYNFAIGGEGTVFEGRGWEVVGAHAAGINSQSIGIAFIGDFVSELPPTTVMQRAKQLISEGVKRGYIQSNYTLHGHRQFSSTECPGEKLYNEIQTWDRFSETKRKLSKKDTPLMAGAVKL